MVSFLSFDLKFKLNISLHIIPPPRFTYCNYPQLLISSQYFKFAQTM